MAQSTPFEGQADRIRTLYQNLIETHKHFHSQPLSAAHFELALRLSERFLDDLKDCPEALLGQLQYPKKSLPDAYNFGFSTYLLTTVLCVRNKINDTCAAQLISAAISMVGLNQRRLQRYFSGKAGFPVLSVPPSLSKALNDTHYDVWLSGCDVGSWSRSPAQQNTANTLHNILYQALFLARTITPGSGRKNATFAQALHSLAPHLSAPGYKVLDQGLSFPGSFPPGTLVKLKDGALCRVVAVLQQGFLARVWPKVASEHPWRKITEQQIVQCAAAKPVSGFAQALQLWDEDWQLHKEELTDLITPRFAVFKLDSPPQVLLDVQAQLESDDADVGKVANRIESEPLLATYLTETATQSNRQKLTVSDVRHGLMMHGFERTRSLLIQQALIVRLNQHQFPLQDAFLQFCRLFSHLASQIIAVKRKSLSEQVSALAYFAATGLFTLPALKGHTVWRRQPTRLFDLNNLVSLTKKGALLDHSLTMTKAWQQPGSFIKAIGQHGVLPEKTLLKGAQADLAITLGLATMLSRQLLFADEISCKESQAYLKQACAHLNVPQSQLESIREQASAYCHTACVVIV